MCAILKFQSCVYVNGTVWRKKKSFLFLVLSEHSTVWFLWNIFWKKSKVAKTNLLNFKYLSRSWQQCVCTSCAKPFLLKCLCAPTSFVASHQLLLWYIRVVLVPSVRRIQTDAKQTTNRRSTKEANDEEPFVDNDWLTNFALQLSLVVAFLPFSMACNLL